METAMRTLTTSVLATGIILAAAPAFATSMGGFHGGPGMSPGGSSLSRGGSIPSGHPGYTPASNSTLAVRTGPVPLKTKPHPPGKLNQACYRACVKTSMGDAFRTDQFCAYSCSLDR
jgi:hypothetical protein